GVRLEAVGADLDLDVWILAKVGVPARVLGRPALGGDDDEVVSLAPVDQRCGARLAGAAAACRQQERRGATPPVVAVLAVGLAIRADMLVAVEVGCVTSCHAVWVPTGTQGSAWCPAARPRADALLLL